jgi:hypothetical protein
MASFSYNFKQHGCHVCAMGGRDMKDALNDCPLFRVFAASGMYLSAFA